jgi:hypothetical protein
MQIKNMKIGFLCPKTTNEVTVLRDEVWFSFDVVGGYEHDVTMRVRKCPGCGEEHLFIVQ